MPSANELRLLREAKFNSDDDWDDEEDAPIEELVRLGWLYQRDAGTRWDYQITSGGELVLRLAPMVMA